MDVIYRYDPYLPVNRPAHADADSALRALAEGNARFTDMAERMRREMMGEAAAGQLVIPVSPLSLGLPVLTGLAPRQTPFALVLGCSDARVPIEAVFDQAFNDLFVVRIAGNVLGVECLGSIDYAVRHLGKSLKVVLVMGHRTCGAVTAAVDTYLDPKDYADIACTHALRSLVDRMMIAVRSAAKALGRVCGPDVAVDVGYRAALIETAVYLNAAVTAFDLRREFAAAGMTDLRIVYAVYDLTTQRVGAVPDGDSPGPFGNAPLHAEDFIALSDRLARGVAARGLLKGAPQRTTG